MDGIKGIHHVTALTSSAEAIYHFFTYTLGMRLVKKTVNQDDIQTYHLFFADDIGSFGTNITFFNSPGLPKGSHGNNEIYQISFRVPNNDALNYWLKRFERLNVNHEGIKELFGKKVLPFTDFDNQQYQLISDENNEGRASGLPWKNGPIPNEYAITGLGPIFIRVEQYGYLKEVLESVHHFNQIDQEGALYLFEIGEGGNGAQVIVEENDFLPPAKQGYGTVHHVAFYVENEETLKEWDVRYRRFGLSTSGTIDRYFFHSLYTRVAPQIVFALATNGPGFLEDETYETLGEKLSLPPFLENQRSYIESKVKSIDTVRSNKIIKKEYE